MILCSWPLRLVLLLFILSDLALAHTYEVKPGDTLSEIAFKQYEDSKPVYGPGGRIELILSLNHQIKDPNILSIGEVIVLDLGQERKVAGSQEDQTSNKPFKAKSIETDAPDIKDAKPEPVFSLSTELGFSYFKIDATDRLSGGKSMFLSSLLPMISLKGAQSIAHDVSIESSLSYRLLKMEPLDSGQSQSHPDGLTKISFGLIKEKPNESYRIAVASSAKLFIRTLSLSSFRLDAVSIPSINGTWKHQLLAYNQTRLSTSIDLSYFFPEEYLSYHIKSGHGLSFQIGAKTSYSNLLLSQDVYYLMETQDSEITKQRTSELGLRVGLTRLF